VCRKVNQLTDEQLTLIGIQQIILDDCIRAILYNKKYGGLERTNHNVFVNSCLTKTLIIQWSQIFGHRDEDIHWSKLDLTKGDSGFDKAKILQCTNFKDEEWTNYHSQIKEIRNKFIAHFDIDKLTGYIPSFEPALKILLCYRQWLIDTFDTAKIEGALIERNFDNNNMLLEAINNELITNFKTI